MLEVATFGPSLVEITPDVQAWLRDIDAYDGWLNLFIQHTSASLLVQENADPDVQTDLRAFFDRFAPPADDPSMAYITHRYEGPDDMPAHIKAAVLPVSLTVPVLASRLALGTWQGIYVVEHRNRPHRRRVLLSLR